MPRRARTNRSGGRASPEGRSASERYLVEAERTRRGRRWAVCCVVVGAALVTAAGRDSGPWAGTRVAEVLGAIIAGMLAWWARPHPDPERWLRGAAGEAATALVLARLPSSYRVLHDRRVPGSAANVDHIVVGPYGVWVIDSKAFRARLRARWRSVWVGRRLLDVSVVVWEASVVEDLLGVPVRPMVVVHGDGLPRRGGRCGGVRVVPAAQLLHRLRGRWWTRPLRQRLLTADDVTVLASRCGRALPPAAGTPPDRRTGRGWHDGPRRASQKR